MHVLNKWYMFAIALGIVGLILWLVAIPQLMSAISETNPPLGSIIIAVIKVVLGLACFLAAIPCLQKGRYENAE